MRLFSNSDCRYHLIRILVSAGRLTLSGQQDSTQPWFPEYVFKLQYGKNERPTPKQVSQDRQLFSLLAAIPMRATDNTLNPSRLQLD